MTIEEYEYVRDPDALCRQCQTNEDIVEDEGGYICTDCLFENSFWERQKADFPDMPWEFAEGHNG
jgi:hypothetical protein